MSQRMRELLRLPAPVLLFALVVCALPARAALITDVADAADVDNPLDVDLGLKWERTQRRAKITREYTDPTSARTFNATELGYERYTHVLTPSVAIGLFHDLEIHGTMPYALHDEQYWDYAQVDGQSVRPNSSLENNRFDANGDCLSPDCLQTRPLLPSPGRVFRGGFLDPTIGIAWGIFNTEREKRLPESWFPPKVRTSTWVIGFDYTMPIVKAADPSKPDPSQPLPNVTLPLGTGAHRLTWWTAMSKRMGFVEPYMRLHYTLPVTSSEAYDNCNIAASDPQNLVMGTEGQNACAPNTPDPFWKGKTGTEFPHVGGLLLGTEIVPVEQKDGLRLAIGIEAGATYTSRGRRMSELSDALRKLTYTDQYVTAEGKLTFDLRFSKWVHVVTYLSLATDTPHFITSESVGKDRWGEDPSRPPDGEVTLKSAEMNPNYDFRIDQPGRRLRVTDVSVFGLSTMVEVNF